MAKFNRKQHRMTSVVSPLLSKPGPSGLTYEGGLGWSRTTEAELFLLAVSDLGEDTFYEKAGDRRARMLDLVQNADPEFLAGFIPWLRNDANMRTAAIVCAAEAGQRTLVSAACQRADEPGEILAYWLKHYGRDIPAWLRRGVADAAVRLYTERNYLKYDRRDAAVRFADVISLVQPRYHHKMWGTWQDDLYKWIIEQRHGRDTQPSERLGIIRANRAWRSAPGIVDGETYMWAGLTWEDVLSALPNVPKRELWTSLIPAMGYMALLRNLRNFDQAGIDDEHALQVASVLQDPAAVAKSRQLPFRFWAAYKAAPSLRWGHALELALHASLGNIPALPGSTLILVDRSGSMFDRLSARSDVIRADVAALFGTCLATRILHDGLNGSGATADLYQFGEVHSRINITAITPVLHTMESFSNLGGTYTAKTVYETYNGHDRVVIITDEQSAAGQSDPGYCVPGDIPVYTWNLGGYRYGHSVSGTAFRHTFGGLTDQSFRMIPLLEAGRSQKWPWLTPSSASPTATT